jgi:hypothetical protein
MKAPRGVCVVALALGLAITIGNVWRGVTPTGSLPRMTRGEPALEVRACAGCHGDIVERFARTPHHNTLVAGTDPQLHERFHRAKQPRAVTHGHYFVLEKRLVFMSPLSDRIYPVDWAFGSGHHAITPVTAGPDIHGRDSGLEHRLSWYPTKEKGLIDFTLGNGDSGSAAAGDEACGRVLDASQTFECFDCHATRVPQRGIGTAWDEIIPGVHCARCHLSEQSHVSAANRGDLDLLMERWSELSPLESIRRCGECHRRVDQLTPDELRPDNAMLVRFAPVGLEQSRCFKKQGAKRLDCTTCHDPHQPAETDPAFYSRICNGCHTGRSSSEPMCAKEPAATDCVQCHLPKVEVQTHLRLSDHWIRVRSDR